MTTSSDSPRPAPRSPYDPETTAENFDWVEWMRERVVDVRLLDTPEGRRALTKNDPLMFALVYLRHHLKDEATGNAVTFGEAHLDWVREAKSWLVRPVQGRNGESSIPRNNRNAYVAPRSMGKSTWWFLIIPMWAAATNRIKFLAAFADSAAQAETHLASFKSELETNERLRLDYPLLCQARRRTRGVTASDNRSSYESDTRFVFMARGIDAASLGMKVGNRRPDLLVMDDVEPGETGYSAHQAQQRLTTITDVILPLNEFARVVLVGTVTMTGSIVHQLVRSSEGGPVETWISDQKFRAKRYLPVVTRADGSEASCWPRKWTLDYLKSIEGTRSYAKNFLNDPMSANGGFWTATDIRHATDPGSAGPRWVLMVDPAVTDKKTSDRTGLAIVSGGGTVPMDSLGARVAVHHAEGVRLVGEPLRQRVLGLLAQWPLVGMVIVETNQGGDLWKSIFHDMPVKMDTHHSSVSKEVRFGEALAHYQRGRVVHVGVHADLEGEMVAFPKGTHDDVVDATMAGVLGFLKPKKRGRESAVA